MIALDNKVAIITGGASGIGKGTVGVFIEAGARVACFDLQDKKGEAMATQYGQRFHYEHVDVTDDAMFKAAVDRVAAKFGRLDVIFNNAGTAEHFLTPALDLDVFDRMHRLLVRSVVAGMKFAVPHLKAAGGGSIINTASVAGLQAGYSPFAYSVAKGALLHVSRLAAARLSQFNIRVNAICPGLIPTAIFGLAAGDNIATADQRAAMIAEVAPTFQPIPQAGRPEDIGYAAVFFASDQSRFVTGQYLAVDGGLTIGPRQAWDVETAKPIYGAMLGLDDAKVEEAFASV
jgi:NAD(P)-dependent dehydrogenase (short-subunit alcohol dehydrogenase family)